MKRKKFIEHGDYLLSHVTDIIKDVYSDFGGLINWATKFSEDALSELLTENEIEKSELFTIIREEIARKTRELSTKAKIEAGEYGTRTHQILEHYYLHDKNIGGVLPQNYANRVRQINNHLDENKLTIKQIELKIYNDDEGYGGTTDLLLQNDKGEYFLYDWKTGSKRYFVDSLQLAAYALAWELETGKKIKGVCDVYLGKDDDVEVEFMSYNEEDLEQAKKAWLETLNIFRYKRVYSNKNYMKNNGRRKNV